MSGISWDMELDNDMDDYWVNIYRDSFTVDESVAYHPETWDTMIIGIRIIVTRLELGRREDTEQPQVWNLPFNLSYAPWRPNTREQPRRLTTPWTTIIILVIWTILGIIQIRQASKSNTLINENDISLATHHSYALYHHTLYNNDDALLLPEPPSRANLANNRSNHSTIRGTRILSSIMSMQQTQKQSPKHRNGQSYAHTRNRNEYILTRLQQLEHQTIKGHDQLEHHPERDKKTSNRA